MHINYTTYSSGKYTDSGKYLTNMRISNAVAMNICKAEHGK